MRFQYTASDGNGQAQHGEIAARDANEAVQILGSRGLRLQSLTEAASSPVVVSDPVMRAPAPSGARFDYVADNRRGERESGTIVARNSLDAVAQLDKQYLRPVEMTRHTTKESVLEMDLKASFKDRFLAFSQIGELLRSGIGPAAAFQQLSTTLPHPGIAQAFGHVARATVEGGRISDVLDLYPGLFPPDVAGMMRAGEAGGFLPQAAMAISEQSHSAHKFRWMFWYFIVVGINAALAIPLMRAFTTAMEAYYDLVEKSGGQMSGNPVAIAFGAVGQKLLWPYGPIIVGLFVVAGILYSVLSTVRYRPLRSRLALKVPVFSKHAQTEAAAIFCWTLSNISKAGVAPVSAWWIAANAIPNIEMRDRFLRAGSMMGESSKLSDVGHANGLLPPEFYSIVRTGETTGNVGESLYRVADLSRVQNDRWKTAAKATGASMGCTALLVTSGILVIMLTYFWFVSMPKKILDGLEWIPLVWAWMKLPR